MKFEIRNRWNASIIFECEADSLRIAVEIAISRRVSLRDSDLRGSNLSGSDLRGSDLRGSDLRDSDLRGSDLRGSDLRDSDLRGSDLRGSNLSGSNLSGSNLSGSNLSDSDLRGSNLSGSNLSGSNLSDSDLRGSNLSGSNLSGSDLSEVKKDFLEKLLKAKGESIGLYKALLDGKVDGSCYEGECACFCGTLANIKGINYQKLQEYAGITPDSSSPVERWFLGIRKGDTPENNPISAITAEWMREFMKEQGMEIPTRSVSWA